MTDNPGQSVTKHRHIPDVLKVPDGNVLLLRAYGRGVQKYACPVSATSKAVPHAILLAGDRNEGDLAAIHFGGPTWKLWMVARSWVMPRTRSILQLQTRMALTG
jgi:hypothetical protein